jgi:hypothetical protein
VLGREPEPVSEPRRYLMRRDRQVVWNDSFLAEEEARVLDPEAQLKYFGQPTELS